MKFLIILSLFVYITGFMSCTRDDETQETFRQSNQDQVIDKPGKSIEDTK